MKLSDIPPHVLQVDPPLFFREYTRKFGYDIEYPEDNIVPLFHLGYYDGPYTGIFKCGEVHFYARALYPDEDRSFWACWELSPSDKEMVLERHKSFQENVGLHTDYVLDDDDYWVVNHVGPVRDKSLWDNFYKNALSAPDWKDYESRPFFSVVKNPFRQRRW